ncbi:hypothetical protein Taro_017039 [Colocasia esculenta]|uniref:Uncharacterized protein n=1 Tax=Colocasia esculenta TaxID=4460 RepID=A0A843UM17_COLES|nr:hypothetical protein [Colocasia esculenta]
MTSSNISLMCYYDGVLRIEDHKPQYEGGIVRILRVKKDTTFTELMRKLYILTKYDERHIKIGITCKWPTSIGEYITVRVEDDETVESMFDLYHSHVSTIQLYLEKEDVDNISIQGNDEVQTHGHIDDNLHTQHYEYQQPTVLFTRMLNDDADSTGFYSANERDVRYESYDYTLPTNYHPWFTGYGGGSSQYPFMPITDPSHTFHSASSPGHHVIEEHVIEEDEEDEIDSQDDIDDNENMDEGDDEPLFDIARVNNTEIEYEQDPPDIFTSDQWINEAMLNNSHEGIDVPCTLEGEEPHVGQIFTNKKNLIYALQIYSVQHIDIGLHIEVLHCNLHLVTGKVVVHIEDAFICIWIRIKKGHPITIVVIVANQDIIEVHVQGYNPLIIIRLDRAGRYSWGGATLAYLYRQLSIACKSDAKAICGSLTLLQMQDLQSHAQARHISQMMQDHLSFSPDVMTFSQHGIYDVGASQILTDEVMPDEITHSQPPQSTVGTYHRQRRHRGSTSTLPQQSQSDLLGETLGSISEDMDSETAQSESCDTILVHETQSQSEIEVEAQGEIQEQCHSRGRASRKGKKRWFPQFF